MANANMTFKANLLPSSNLGYNLGSSTQQWNIYGTLTGNASTATKISSTPNNTSTFLRGDNAWSETLQNTIQSFVIKSTDTANYSIYRLYCGDNNGLIFLNGTGRTEDGGASMMTIRNNSGDLRLDSKANLNLLDGVVTLNKSVGCLEIWTKSGGNYRDGLRIHARSNGDWAAITLLGTDNATSSGTSTKSWFIGNNSSSGDFYIGKDGTGGSGVFLRNINGVWAWNGTANGSISGNAATATKATQDGSGNTITSKYVTLDTSQTISGGKTFSAGTAVSSTGSNRATFYLTSVANVPNDFWMGSNNATKWSLTCRASDESYMLGLYSNVSGSQGWKMRWYHNGEVYCSKLYGAVWNDYAEYRKDNLLEKQEPGRCVYENGDGTLSLTTKRLMRGCEIISDTFGFAIGQDKDNGYNTPIASNGRVLAYPYENIEDFRKNIGHGVCSGPNGTVSIMTDEEEEKYPLRAIGTISEIPNYEEWGTGKVQVNGRVWIRIR